MGRGFHRHPGCNRSGGRDRLVEGERTALAFVTFEFDFAAKQTRKLTTDSQPKTSATITTTRTSIRLLERLEDRVLLLRWNSNSTIANRKREHSLCAFERRMPRAPTRRGRRDSQPDITALRKFKRIRQEIFQNLIQPLRVGIGDRTVNATTSRLPLSATNTRRSRRLSRVSGSTKKRMRIGRGIGSGLGKTSGRGGKGASARGGGPYWKRGHEGGQTSIFRRFPKRGFSNHDWANRFHIVNVADLERFENGSTVDATALIEAGLVPNERQPVKIGEALPGLDAFFQLDDCHIDRDIAFRVAGTPHAIRHVRERREPRFGGAGASLDS